MELQPSHVASCQKKKLKPTTKHAAKQVTVLNCCLLSADCYHINAKKNCWHLVATRIRDSMQQAARDTSPVQLCATQKAAQLWCMHGPHDSVTEVQSLHGAFVTEKLAVGHSLHDVHMIMPCGMVSCGK